jgi:hypothetical protein
MGKPNLDGHEGARIDFDSRSQTSMSLSKFVLRLLFFRQSARWPVVEKAPGARNLRALLIVLYRPSYVTFTPLAILLANSYMSS